MFRAFINKNLFTQTLTISYNICYGRVPDFNNQLTMKARIMSQVRKI